MTTTRTEDRAEDQAAAQYSSIVSMLAAVECDYDRLEELRDERSAWLEENPGSFIDPKDPRNGGRWVMAFPDEAEELEELEDEAGDCTDEDDARQRISEDPLSVEVRSDWASPGDELTPGEFQILLCTGGPAVRIMGELDQYGTPCRAWLEYQDWGTPWTQYFGAKSDTLCQYAAHFLG